MAPLALLALAALAQTAAPDGAARVEAKVEAGLKALTLDEKIALLGGVDGFDIRAIPKLGLPRIRMSDGPAGVRNFGPTTAYPAPLALAATFDEPLALAYGTAIGRDARARGVHVWLGPGVNLARVVQNGRNFEYFGEDPFVAARMAVGVIRGVQGQGVVATVKHFAGNEHESDRNADSSEIAERPLRELYLRPFEAAVKEANVGAVMSGYNLLNGVHASESRPLIVDVLKGEWGFRGVHMSDWGGAHSTLGTVRNGLDLEMPGPEFMNAATIKPLLASGEVTEAMLDEKVRRILRVEYAMGFGERPQTDPAIPRADPASEATALRIAREGTVLLKNARNVLPLRGGTLLVLNATTPLTGGGGSSYTTPTRALSLADALRGLAGSRVTSRRGLLDPAAAFEATPFVGPLKGEYFANRDLRGTPALVRDDAHVAFDWGDGPPAPGLPKDGFSVRWTGTYRPTATGDHTLVARTDDGVRVLVDGRRVIDAWNDRGATTDRATVRMEAGKSYAVTVEYYDAGGAAVAGFGILPPGPARSDVTDAEIREAGTVVVGTGLGPDREGEGFDRPFELPADQQALLRRVLALNPRTVVVNSSGGPVDLAPFEGDAAAIVQAWYPGGEGDLAVAEILLGLANPSGRLPLTWPRTLKGTYYEGAYPSKDRKMVYREGLFMGYRWFDRNGAKPLYPFGHGLSYTTFALSGLKAAPGADGGVEATLSVRNTGRTAGTGTVQMYAGYPRSAVERPVRELKAFARVPLAPGETKRVTLTIPRPWLAYWDVKARAWAVEPGDVEISAGPSSRDLPLRATLRLR